MKKQQVIDVISFLKKGLSDKKSLDALGHLTETLETVEFSVAKKKIKNHLLMTKFPLTPEMSSSKKCIGLFSDGASRGNPGPGSWGSLGTDSNGEILFQASSVELGATNNQMEMQGAIYALEWILEHQSDVGCDLDTTIFLYSDSKYVIDGINSWMINWKKRGWKKADKKAPENLELWQKLDKVTGELRNLKCLWVKGHAGHPQNEFCDQLANVALDEAGY